MPNIIESYFHINKYQKTIRLVAHILCIIPFFWLLFALFFNFLGANPLETLLTVSGHSGFILLLLSMSITPLRRWLVWGFSIFQALKFGRRLSDWNMLILLRRPLGLYSFFYSCLHFYFYFNFELGLLLSELIFEIRSSKLIITGVLSLGILFVLSVTSLPVFLKKMKRWWRRVHRSVYILGIFVFIHFFWSAKVTDMTPYLYLLVLVILLGHRILVSSLKRLKRKDDDGMQLYRNNKFNS